MIFDNQTAIYPLVIENTGAIDRNVTIFVSGVNIAAVSFAEDSITYNGSSVLNGSIVYNCSSIINGSTSQYTFITDEQPASSSSVIDVILSPIQDGACDFNITVTPVDGNLTFAANCTVNIDDTTPPVVQWAINNLAFDPASGVDVNFTVTAHDPESGIDANRVYMAFGGTVFTTLGTHVATLPAIGTYNVEFRIPNARIRFGKMDSLWTNETFSYNLNLGAVANLFNNTVFMSPASAWLNANDKSTMLGKISVMYLLFNAGDIHGTYVMLLNDIKPELTGQTTCENERPFDCGIYTRSWVTNAALRAELLSGCDLLLQSIKSIDPIATLVSQLKTQCSVASWDKLSHEQAMLDKISNLNNTLNVGDYPDAIAMLLNDIEPKLTSITTAGPTRCRCDGRFTNSWVTDAASQAVFKNLCEKLLRNLTIVAPSTFIINQMKAQCSLASWNSSGHEQAMLAKIGSLQALLSAKEYGRAEDILLNDIVPRLTVIQNGDDREYNCGCVCSMPWVTDTTSQSQFRVMCSALLVEIQFHLDNCYRQD